MFEAVARFLANCAGPAGTLLVLDDLQWAGADALDLLNWLVRSQGTSLRVVGAYRDTEAPLQMPLGALLADLAHANLAGHCRLGPLADHEARQLLRELLADWEHHEREMLEQQLVLRVGAVPFFLVSCARALGVDRSADQEEAQLPWNVEQSIRQRVAVLPSDAQALLGVAAVAGRVVPYQVLVAVAEQPEQVVLAGLDAVRRARLLEELETDAYRFAHDVIREVVEADLGIARQAVLHRRIAEALEARPGKWPIEMLAFHFARSNAREKAAAYLEQAGDQALARHAYAAAAAYYQEALDHPTDPDRAPAAARIREKLAERLGDPRHMAWIAGMKAIPRVYSGDWAGARAHAERAVTIYRQFGLSSRFALGLDRRGIVRMHAGEWPEATRYLQEVLALDEVGGDLARLRMDHGALAEIELGQGRPEAARARLRPLLDRPGLEEEFGTVYVLPRLALATLELGEVRAANDLAVATVRRARAMGSPLILAEALRAQALVARRQRWWAEAEHALEEGLAAARSVPYPYGEARLLHARGQLHADNAESQAARERLEAARTIFQRLGAHKDLEWTEQLLTSLGWQTRELA